MEGNAFSPSICGVALWEWRALGTMTATGRGRRQGLPGWVGCPRSTWLPERRDTQNGEREMGAILYR